MKRMIGVAVLLIGSAWIPAAAFAAPELEALPLSAPSADMLSLAAAQVTAGPTFFYVGTAVDSIGRESAFSAEASATLTLTSTTVTLNWTASTSTVAGYNMYRSPTTGGPYKKINSALVSGVTSFVDPFPLPVAPSGWTAKAN